MVGESYVDEVGVHERTDRKSIADEDQTNGKEHSDVDDRSSRERFGNGFVVKERQTLVMLLLYVDDIIVTGNDDDDEIMQLVIMLGVRFAMKDLGNLKYFLGVEVECTVQGGRQVNLIAYFDADWTGYLDTRRLFLIGLQKYRKGNSKSISRVVIKTRTSAQVKSHAQKYYIRQNALTQKKEKKHISIHNMSVDDLDTQATEELSATESVFDMIHKISGPRVRSTQYYAPNHSPLGCQLPMQEPTLNVLLSPNFIQS
ncbi:hypothetical protein AMTRI_Chr12g273220 [Amborella trichopoda]